MNMLETTLFLAGDVMTGRGIDQVLPRPGDPALHQYNRLNALDYVRRAEAASGPVRAPIDYAEIWGDALPEWEKRDPDVRIVNLETAVTASDDYWPQKPIHYRMSPGNVPCLTAAGFDCCVLANNHVLDWGTAGLAETLQTLRQAGLRTAGAGPDKRAAAEPAVLDLKGKGRVLVFAWAHPSSFTPLSWAAGAARPGVNLLDGYTARAIAGIKEQVAAVRREGDIVVASIHWGRNWGHGVEFRRRWFAHRLIDTAGIHVVHGHSSHHPIAVEVYRNQPILYGCGDLMNDYEGSIDYAKCRPDLANMYFVRLQIPSGRLLDMTVVPMQIRRFRLQRAGRADARWLCDTLNRGGIPASAAAKLKRWARLRRTRFNCRWELEEDGAIRVAAAP
jgi:poly-gamma-glutamate synthesis protein (capsule biosynthesis protein)